MDDELLRLAASGPFTAAEAVRRLKQSRATVARRLKAEVEAGRLERRGEARATTYVLGATRFHWRRAGLDEHAAWKAVEPTLRSVADLGSDALTTLNYCVTEMVNNAVDHSAGRRVEVVVRRERAELVIEVIDDGVGVFENVMHAHGLASVEDAVVQLEKGKLTSQPMRHSGQGLFFTSKAARRFRIESGNLAWIVDNSVDDRAITYLPKPLRGTRVELRFVPKAVPALAAVFAGWAEPGAGFDTTRTTVKLAAHGAILISRSEAKRVAAGLEKFTHVIVDFAGVDTVGQGFVDELFRVFAAAHPRVALEPVHMSAAVAFMVGRGLPR